MTTERMLHYNRTVEGRTESDLVQDEIDEAKRLLEATHLEVQAAQSKVTEPSARRDRRDGQDQKPDGSEPEVNQSMKTGQKKRQLSNIKKTKTMWRRWNEAIEEEEEEERLQSKKDITVQCIEFCEVTTAKVHAVLHRALSDLRGRKFSQHPRVRVATLCFRENPHCCLQILHEGMFQIFRCAYALLRVLSTTENQESRKLLDEIQQQPSVLVLSGPAVAITNVVTASEFLAGGWTKESVVVCT